MLPSTCLQPADTQALQAHVCCLLQDVDWGDLDYLVIDAPPGTSDEHISIAQFLKDANVDGAVIVTTPQEVALADVRKEINFAKKVCCLAGLCTVPYHAVGVPCHAFSGRD